MRETGRSSPWLLPLPFPSEGQGSQDLPDDLRSLVLLYLPSSSHCVGLCGTCPPQAPQPFINELSPPIQFQCRAGSSQSRNTFAKLSKELSGWLFLQNFSFCFGEPHPERPLLSLTSFSELSGKAFCKEYHLLAQQIAMLTQGSQVFQGPHSEV